jgi:cytochrome c oxidase subunit 2
MERGPIVLVWFLIISGAAVAIMLAVALSTRRAPLEQADVTRSAYALRRWWLWLLVAAVIVSFALSVPSFPYTVAAQKNPVQHYSVIARQYVFQGPVSVPLDTELIFDVTSVDVNHGFGIYDPNGELVAQVQAMPQYTNHLPVKFVIPGKYTIRCLEYCGIAHHVMQAGFEVR